MLILLEHQIQHHGSKNISQSLKFHGRLERRQSHKQFISISHKCTQDSNLGLKRHGNIDLSKSHFQNLNLNLIIDHKLLQGLSQGRIKLGIQPALKPHLCINPSLLQSLNQGH